MLLIDFNITDQLKNIMADTFHAGCDEVTRRRYMYFLDTCNFGYIDGGLRPEPEPIFHCDICHKPIHRWQDYTDELPGHDEVHMDCVYELDNDDWVEMLRIKFKVAI